jgi:hypothetical protein
MPSMSLSFMMSSSSSPILTSAPDHFPKNTITGLDVEGGELAVLVAPARADGDHFAFLRLLLGGIGDDDAAFGLLFALEAFDHDSVMQGTECHVVSFLFWAAGFPEQYGSRGKWISEKHLLALVYIECQLVEGKYEHPCGLSRRRPPDADRQDLHGIMRSLD